MNTYLLLILFDLGGIHHDLDLTEVFMFLLGYFSTQVPADTQNPVLLVGLPSWKTDEEGDPGTGRGRRKERQDLGIVDT